MPRISNDDLFDAFRPSIFRIATRWFNGGSVATAFAVARLAKSNRLVLATAAHVPDLPKAEPVEWIIQQFDGDAKVERELVVESKGPDSGPIAYRWHKSFDVGICVLPEAGPDGTVFARPNETGVNLYPERVMPGTGTSVSWAGFAGIIEQYAEHPHLCYFEGAICATVNRADKHLYLVDGHSAHGVSGGPLWTWSGERNRAEVVGVMSEYGCASQGLPGFCVFEPIEHIRQYLKWWNEQTSQAEEARGD